MIAAYPAATRVVILQAPFDDVREVHVLPGAPTIEQAAGMSPAMIRRLHPDDRQAIFTASKI
jgi:hypothetical protein